MQPTNSRFMILQTLKSLTAWVFQGDATEDDFIRCRFRNLHF